MIVKVQLSQSERDGIKRMLVYNNDRSAVYEGEATNEVIDVMQKMQKRFFHADFIDNKDGSKRIQIIKPASWQKW